MCGGHFIHLLISEQRQAVEQRPPDSRLTSSPPPARCPSCGAAIEAAFTWCPKCGVGLKALPCAYCGQIADPGDRNCRYCGAPVGKR